MHLKPKELNSQASPRCFVFLFPFFFRSLSVITSFYDDNHNCMKGRSGMSVSFQWQKTTETHKHAKLVI